MEVQQDFKKLLALFNARKVDYMIVGGYALAYHGAPRYTGDLDILIKSDTTNAQKILDALSEFGFSSLGLTVDDFSQPDKVVQLGVPPVRVDILTSITGVSWDHAQANKKLGHYGEVPTFYIGKKDFIMNKKATHRHQDLADIESLGETAD